MSISTTIARLATVLTAVNPSPQPALRRIYSDPAEAVNLADMPSLVIGLSATIPQQFTEEAMGLLRHDYGLTLWLFLGVRQTPLPELHSRALPWGLAIATVLAANLKLGGIVQQIGAGEFNQPLITFRAGPIPWGMDAQGQPLSYWGLTGQLPIVEKINTEMGIGS